MDPTAALVDLLDALRRRDRETAFDRLEALLDWLEHFQFHCFAYPECWK